MADGPAENVLWMWTIGELALLAVPLGVLVGSFLGWNVFLSGVSRQLRIAGVAVLVVELLIPA